jgi:hypothetical protein
MQVIAVTELRMTEILGYASRSVLGVEIADGNGDAHVYALRFEPGGEIGPHPAGFGQILIPVVGSGWVAGSDHLRQPLPAGSAALIERGEIHSKGSDTGMSALMIQIRDIMPS